MLSLMLSCMFTYGMHISTYFVGTEAFLLCVEGQDAGGPTLCLRDSLFQDTRLAHYLKRLKSDGVRLPFIKISFCFSI